MRRIVTFFIIVFVPFSASFASYYRRAFFDMYSEFISAPPLIYNRALGGYYNPASVAFLKTSDCTLFWSDKTRKNMDYHTWGLFLGSPNMGLGLIREKYLGDEMFNYRLSYAAGSEKFALGIAYGLGKGDGAFQRQDKTHMVYGAIWQPFSYMIVGGSLLLENYSNYKEKNFYIGFTPFSNKKHAFFYEYNSQSFDDYEGSFKNYGFCLSIIKNMLVTSKIFDDDSFTIGLALEFNSLGILNNSIFDKNKNRLYDMYGIAIYTAED